MKPAANLTQCTSAQLYTRHRVRTKRFSVLTQLRGLVFLLTSGVDATDAGTQKSIATASYAFAVKLASIPDECLGYGQERHAHHRKAKMKKAVPLHQ